MCLNLFDLSMQSGIVTRQISAENPTGEKNRGCLAAPGPEIPNSMAAARLGKGWKVEPFISLASNKTRTIADIKGPGCINYLFITSETQYFCALVLRIYWDDEEFPSMESPLGAFFAMGHDFAPHEVSSLMVTVAPHRGMSCYWQMPFRRRARITLTNEGPFDANIVAYKVLYKLHGIPGEAAYFHAQYRRSITDERCPEHIILDGVKGKGVYVGTYLAWNPFSSGWWGEGEVKIFIDGDENPSIADNSTEDYFGGAWNFGADNALFDHQFHQEERTYSAPFVGLALAKSNNPHGPRKYSMYRWHILDSIGFQQDIRVTVQSLGWLPDSTFRPGVDDIGSVAYWYQMEPHERFPALPGLEQRWDR